MKTAIRPIRRDVHAVVLISSEHDWQEMRDAFPDLRPGSALGTEWTSRAFGKRRVVFVQTGADPVAAAAHAQHAADHWRPHRFIAAGALEQGAATAFEWVAEHNRILLEREGFETIPELLASFGEPSVPDPVVALPDGSAD
jgi:hypothetical protein